VSLAFAVAASANLPSILFSLYWKRFNTGLGDVDLRRPHLGARADRVLPRRDGGGRKRPKPLATAMLPDLHWGWFPLDNPAIVSVPIGFLFGVIGTLTSKGPTPRSSGDGSPFAHRSRRREGRSIH